VTRQTKIRLKRRAVFFGSAVGFAFAVLIWKNAPTKPSPQLIALGVGAAAHASAVSFVAFSRIRRTSRVDTPDIDLAGIHSTGISFPRRTLETAVIPNTTPFDPPQRAVDQAPKRGPPVA
jgi:hypothetical protein